MSFKCTTTERLVIFDYRPTDSLTPCFVGGKNEYACSVPQTECGLDISDLPENDQTKTFREVASRFGSSTILSRADLYHFVSVDRRCPQDMSLYEYFFDRQGYFDRFIADVEAFAEQYLYHRLDSHSQEQTGPRVGCSGPLQYDEPYRSGHCD